ncbi:hypothetical protein BU17DRAFT_100064 [Hysterangium stoloniferum]|nr:hypothetical protein BU17DRAFT_100064 [Hysterangium stoloniferum]
MGASSKSSNAHYDLHVRLRHRGPHCYARRSRDVYRVILPEAAQCFSRARTGASLALVDFRAEVRTGAAGWARDTPGVRERVSVLKGDLRLLAREDSMNDDEIVCVSWNWIRPRPSPTRMAILTLSLP